MSGGTDVEIDLLRYVRLVPAVVGVIVVVVVAVD
jgi:hypothetical protein